MGTRAHNDEIIKWRFVKMKEEGYTNRESMEKLGILNVYQIKTWMRWHQTGETHRFSQLVGKQYSFGKGPTALNELEQRDLEIRRLITKVAVLEKFVEVSRRWGQKLL